MTRARPVYRPGETLIHFSSLPGAAHRNSPDPRAVNDDSGGRSPSNTKGGSRDRSEALAREVFAVTPPRNVPYEFLLIGGRKMKSSAGTGAAADAMVELLPPELVRFLMLRHRPSATIEFDPSGETIPRLFDEYDAWVAHSSARPKPLTSAPAARNGHTGSEWATAKIAGTTAEMPRYLTSEPTRLSAPETSTPSLGRGA